MSAAIFVVWWPLSALVFKTASGKTEDDEESKSFILFIMLVGLQIIKDKYERSTS